MTTSQLRNNLHQLIDTISDKNVLQAIETILSSKEEIVGYSISGEPLTINEYKKKIKTATDRVDAGEYFSHAEVKKQFSFARK